MERLETINSYENFRWFFTSEGTLAIGGKSDEQNEIVIKNFLNPKFFVLHTTEPGSPFMIIQKENPSKKEINETAIFCACFSKQWKLGKKIISVDVFRGEQIYKTRSMKKGTFGVIGKKDVIKVRPKLFLVIQRGKLRAVPKVVNEKKLGVITQGNLTKEEAADIIFKKIKDYYHLPLLKEEIMAAIPSDKINVKFNIR